MHTLTNLPCGWMFNPDPPNTVEENRRMRAVLEELRANFTARSIEECRAGAHATYNGGHHDESRREAFHHGMDTVYNIRGAQGKVICEMIDSVLRNDPRGSEAETSVHPAAQKQLGEIAAAEAAGLAHWIENGEIKTAQPVDKAKFGEHNYPHPMGTSDCSYGCGCWMGQCRSGGPVDPFGPCPNNPMARETRPCVCGATMMRWRPPHDPTDTAIRWRCPRCYATLPCADQSIPKQQ